MVLLCVSVLAIFTSLKHDFSKVILMLGDFTFVELRKYA